ncbi:MAG: DUF1353 domain-containing protein [Lentisphaeria bacterium]|nr:DUF1353 domain-containing protein [Lentisphaeria bacterium]
MEFCRLCRPNRNVAPCIDGRTIRAAIIHDWLYSTAILSRKQAD